MSVELVMRLYSETVIRFYEGTKEQRMKDKVLSVELCVIEKESGDRRQESGRQNKDKGQRIKDKVLSYEL